MQKMSFPLYYLTWNVTCKCNLRCEHCYNALFDRNRVEDELSTKEGVEMISQAKNLGLKAILFTGGEPLLRKDLPSLIKFAKDKRLIIFLATNGTLIDKSFIKEFKGVIDGINISLDAATSKKHDEIRGVKGCFIKTLNSIGTLQKHFPISIAFTATQKNLSELSSVAKIAKRYKIPLKIKRFISMGIGSRNQELTLSKSNYKILIEQIRQLRKSQKVLFSDPIWLSLNEERINSYGGCLAGIFSICLDFNGTAYPCTKLKIPLGNIRNTSLKKIWRKSKILIKLRKKRLKGKCKNCEKRYSCGGCRAAAYIKTGDFLTEDPLCFL